MYWFINRTKMISSSSSNNNNNNDNNSNQIKSNHLGGQEGLIKLLRLLLSPKHYLLSMHGIPVHQSSAAAAAAICLNESDEFDNKFIRQQLVEQSNICPSHVKMKFNKFRLVVLLLVLPVMQLFCHHHPCSSSSSSSIWIKRKSLHKRKKSALANNKKSRQDKSQPRRRNTKWNTKQRRRKTWGDGQTSPPSINQYSLWSSALIYAQGRIELQL